EIVNPELAVAAQDELPADPQVDPASVGSAEVIGVERRQPVGGPPESVCLDFEGPQDEVGGEVGAGGGREIRKRGPVGRPSLSVAAGEVEEEAGHRVMKPGE